MHSFFPSWLELFTENGGETANSLRMQCALLSAVADHIAGEEVYIPYPEGVQIEELTESEFFKGLEDAKKQGWLGEMRWAFNNRAILVTLTIPEGLSVDVGISD